MAKDRHERQHAGWATLPSPDGVAGQAGDSFSDNPGRRCAPAGVDPVRSLDSDRKCIRTDLPERLDSLLLGESALVYQHLRDQLASLFDDAGH
jgi:hypothetical protein